MIALPQVLRAAIAEAQREEIDADAYWDRVREVRTLPPGELWGHVELLARDADPRLRALVPDVLRGCGRGDASWPERVVPLFAEMLREEQEPLVLVSIGDAFTEIHHPTELALVQPLGHHADPAVRRAAICGMRSEEAVDDLVRLTMDSDDEVRNWATFTLGTRVETDTAAVRDALAHRLTDEHEETRAEAVLGLAIRGDRRALPVVRRELEAQSEWSQHVEAAALYADPSLYDALLAYEETPASAPYLARARAACAPSQS